MTSDGPLATRTMQFADHFSKQAADYAKFRPGYPSELFNWLHSLTSTHELAWDVGTGSGQAAIELAKFFSRVVATDPSAAQIANAQRHPRVDYRVQPAEQCDLNPASVGLITVAQAIHWFDFARFYREAMRVLKPSGALVAWTYGLNEVAPEVDAIVRDFCRDVVGPYWPPERAYIEAHYRTIPFPFAEIAPPSLCMETVWTVDDYLGYLRTWSATQRYAEARHADPVEQIANALRSAWGAGARVVRWPIYARAGRLA